MREVGHTSRFEDEGIENYKVGAGKKAGRRLRGVLKKDTERKLIDQYKQKELQNKTYSKKNAVSGWSVIWILGKRQP